MKHFYTYFICTTLFIFSCKNANQTNVKVGLVETPQNSDSRQGTNIHDRFSPPIGFKRTEVSKESFGYYLRNFSLLPDGELVHYYDGTIKHGQESHAAILDIDVGHKDLQQCADATMRLRAEYLFQQKRYNEIAFDFTNGWRFEYQKWRAGNNLLVKGNKTSWTKSSNKRESYKEFRKYLDHVFMYAGTLSLSRELKSKALENIEIGDIILKGGSPGHAVIIVDISINPTNGDKAFMIAQSYMPAQQIHILKNLQTLNNSPWYLISDIDNQIITPDWTFDRTQIKSYD